MSHVVLTDAARRNVEETGADVEADVRAIRDGSHTEHSLLAHCLDGADPDRVQGWHDYVAAVVIAAARRGRL